MGDISLEKFLQIISGRVLLDQGKKNQIIFSLMSLKIEFVLIRSKVQRDFFSKCFSTRLLAQEVTPPSAKQ